jgi:hypothetical protein
VQGWGCPGEGPKQTVPRHFLVERTTRASPAASGRSAPSGAACQTICGSSTCPGHSEASRRAWLAQGPRLTPWALLEVAHRFSPLEGLSTRCFHGPSDHDTLTVPAHIVAAAKRFRSPETATACAPAPRAAETARSQTAGRASDTAFISHSHAAEGSLAPALQREAVQSVDASGRIACPSRTRQ